MKAGVKSCLEPVEVEGTFFSHFKICLPASSREGNSVMLPVWMAGGDKRT